MGFVIHNSRYLGSIWLWPEHATFPSGTPGETMRQAYGMIMQQMLYQNLYHLQCVCHLELLKSRSEEGEKAVAITSRHSPPA